MGTWGTNAATATCAQSTRSRRGRKGSNSPCARSRGPGSRHTTRAFVCRQWGKAWSKHAPRLEHVGVFLTQGLGTNFRRGAAWENFRCDFGTPHYTQRAAQLLLSPTKRGGCWQGGGADAASSDMPPTACPLHGIWHIVSMSNCMHLAPLFAQGETIAWICLSCLLRRKRDPT